MLTKLDRDDVETMREVLRVERLACITAETEARKARRFDVAEAWKTRAERCKKLAGVLAEPGEHDLSFRGPPPADEGIDL